jgi:hypothetical protein
LEHEPEQDILRAMGGTSSAAITRAKSAFGVPVGIHDDAGTFNFAEHGLAQGHE